MIDFLAKRTPVHFYSVPDFPDYHPEFPGGKPQGGRTLECPPFRMVNWASGATK